MTETEHPIASTTDAAEFRALAESVMGRDWIQRLARALDVNLRTAQRWASAGKVISPRAWEFLREQRAAIDRADFDVLITAAIAEARAAGASPHAVAGLLRDYADLLHEGEHS